VRRTSAAWIGLVARLIVGLTFLVAGWDKFQDPAETVRDTRNFQLLPEAVVPTFGHLLPIVEMVLGLCLLLGLLTRPSGAVLAVLLVAFIVGISSAWARGLTIRCGCFGQGGLSDNPVPGYRLDIARDVGLLLLSLWLVWRPRTPLSLDRLLFPDNERLDDGSEGSEGPALQD
jgi:uncharacterized membrane protein YphA (DoxX/SURF4 family)